MYLYFDRNGTLKEQVNDDVARVGNSDVNEIYVYWEKVDDDVDEDNPQYVDYCKATYYNAETLQILAPDQMTFVSTLAKVPFNKKRDLYFFRYFKEYKFYKFVVPDEVLNQAQTVVLDTKFVVTDQNLQEDDEDNAIGIYSMGQVAFEVQGEEGSRVIAPDNAINIAQWNALIKNISYIRNQITQYEEDEENTTFNYTLQDSIDFTATVSGVLSIALTIPQDISHGFMAGFNWKSGALATNFSITNNSGFELKRLKLGNPITTEEYVIPANKAYQTVFWCDGNYVYCNLLEV